MKKDRSIKKTIETDHQIIQSIAKSISTLNHSSEAMATSVDRMATGIEDINKGWNERHAELMKNQDKWMKMQATFTTTVLIILAGVLGLRVL